jgi:hypothetical protein
MPEFFDFFDPTPEEQNVVLVDGHDEALAYAIIHVQDH